MQPSACSIHTLNASVVNNAGTCGDQHAPWAGKTDSSD